MSNRLRASSCIAALLFALMLAMPGAARAEDGPTLEANKTEVEAGRTLRFTGTGFRPNKVVSVWASKGNDNYKDHNEPRARKDGTISFDFSIPNDIETGEWVMKAEDTSNTDDGKPIATARFIVEEAKDRFEISPSSGPAETKFSFVVGGFAGNKKVAVEFTAPDGKLYEYHSSGKCSDDDRVLESVDKETGKVSFSWQAPANAQTGRWLIRMIGTKTSTTRVVGFSITASRSASGGCKSK